MNVARINVPLALVGSLLSAVAGAGAVWGSTKGDLTRTTEAVAKLQEEREQHALRLQALELKMDESLRMLRRIERKLGTDP